VTLTADVQRLIDLAATEYGTLDIFVNDVRIVDLGSVVRTSEESWNRVFAVNLRSVFLTMKYATNLRSNLLMPAPMKCSAIVG
jgi:NAD(P)-dependent dehydrogenase (short-subunit alcohol dehydrogenase family)